MAQSRTIRLTKHGKVPALWQVYQSMFWKEKLKPLVDPVHAKELKASGATKLTKQECIKILNTIVQGKFEKEVLEVIKKVQAAREELRKATLEGKLASNEELQKNISLLPSTLTTCVKSLNKEAGWVFTILSGGPEPRLGGALSSVIVNGSAGMIEGGFEEHLEEEGYQELILKWDQFLQSAYPESVHTSSTQLQDKPNTDNNVSQFTSDSATCYLNKHNNKCVKSKLKLKKPPKHIKSAYEHDRRYNITKNEKVFLKLFGSKKPNLLSRHKFTKPSTKEPASTGRAKKTIRSIFIAPIEANQGSWSTLSHPALSPSAATSVDVAEPPRSPQYPSPHVNTPNKANATKPSCKSQRAPPLALLAPSTLEKTSPTDKGSTAIPKSLQHSTTPPLDPNLQLSPTLCPSSKLFPFIDKS
ncbi:hypothetical protein NP233_g11355 [Leucocoprinus birnbaumii]|uniref:Uncharacterized protein n=1 Tax=Leucocoprinus birnbaumii TaxID=56174 RepID=A0AAD5VMN9_9AGAR|nr:hypothetical protein NP233_g11355 [Leucocoprinus birnbaumii]